MSESRWYLGFGASTELYELNNQFHQAVQDGCSDKERADRLYKLLSQFIDECLDQYFLDPVDRVKLNKVGHKIVSGGVSAMKKTLHVTFKQILKKLSKEDIDIIANYISNLLMPLRESSSYPTYVAVGISDDLRARLGRAVHQGKENGPDEATAKEYADALCELVDVAIECYMGKPLDMVGLGKIMRKITIVAIDTVRGAAQAVIRKVIPSMSEKEILKFFEFSESILYPHPDLAQAQTA